jgi:carbonic anhydrase
MWAHNRKSQAGINPETALAYLKEGNKRFRSNLKLHRDHLQQVNQTSDGQYPFAAVLSCIDSRTSAELIFDQGLGDILSIRIAGNILNEDILGSLEYACKIAGSKLIVVLGHTKCGAITSACNDMVLGHFTHLLDKIRPAIDAEKQAGGADGDDQMAFINRVSAGHVRMTIRHIRHKSSLLAGMEEKGEIMIIGGFYRVESGEVEFYQQDRVKTLQPDQKR